MSYYASSSLPWSLYRGFGLILTSMRVELQNSSSFRFFSLRRFLVVGLTVIFYPIYQMIEHFGLQLDDVLFKSYKAQPITRPIFIISNARSGSTLLQKTVMANSKIVKSPNLMEMIFLQSITWRLASWGFFVIDKYVMFGFFNNMASLVERRFNSKCAHSFPHPFELGNEDEDEWMMASIGASQLMALFFPLLQDNSPIMRLVAFDRELSVKERMNLINVFYRGLIQRHLYFQTRFIGCTQVRYVAKNPTFTLRLRTLLEAFPDADIVVVVRDPYEAIPSMVSYISAWWWMVATPTITYPYRDELQGMCGEHYTYPKQIAKEFPNASMTFVKYEDLVKDPNAVVRELLKKLNVPLTTQLEQSLIAVKQNFVHKHSVSGTLGLSNTEFEKRHSAVFEAYPEYSKRNL